MVNPRVFFDFSIEDERLGRVVFELFANVVPKTCENFRTLATGEKGISPITQFPLSYKGTIIHRSIPGFMIQGGDFTKKNGSGGESIYGGTFEDENFDMDLDVEGLLVMANRGPHTNGSQFFITLRSCSHLNGKHVVFGRVVTGYDIVKKIAEVPTDSKDRPLRPIIISGTGELVLRKKAVPPREVRSPVSPRQSSKRIRSRSSSVSSSSYRSRSPIRSRSRSLPRNDKDRHQVFGRAMSIQSDRRSRSRSGSRERRKRSSRSDKHRRSSKKSKKSRRDDDSKVRDREDSGKSSKALPEETEAELDARLEREEKERMEEGRRREAAALRNSLKYSRRQEKSSGVRFKGRGTMKYRDPELSGW